MRAEGGAFKITPSRFRLGDAHQRITYWLSPGRRVVLLTVFRKTNMREQAGVDRAHAAQRSSEAEHEAAAEHDLYSRNHRSRRTRRRGPARPAGASPPG